MIRGRFVPREDKVIERFKRERSSGNETTKGDETYERED